MIADARHQSVTCFSSPSEGAACAESNVVTKRGERPCTLTQADERGWQKRAGKARQIECLARPMQGCDQESPDAAAGMPRGPKLAALGGRWSEILLKKYGIVFGACVHLATDEILGIGVMTRQVRRIFMIDMGIRDLRDRISALMQARGEEGR